MSTARAGKQFLERKKHVYEDRTIARNMRFGIRLGDVSSALSDDHTKLDCKIDNSGRLPLAHAAHGPSW